MPHDSSTEQSSRFDRFLDVAERLLDEEEEGYVELGDEVEFDDDDGTESFAAVDDDEYDDE